MSQLKKCNRCKKEKEMSCFVSYIGKETKRCDRCRKLNNKNVIKNQCVHGRRKHRCVDCKGVNICEHNKLITYCKECKGNGICEHNIRKRYCKRCKGKGICEHGKVNRQCKICKPFDHFSGCIRARIRMALQSNKKNKTIEYLGCSIEEYKKHIEEQFTEGMTWENYGEWQIDHIIPLKYNNPTMEELIERLHYKNTQPLWAEENIAKGNRYIG